jgi:hypothetical protein
VCQNGVYSMTIKVGSGGGGIFTAKAISGRVQLASGAAAGDIITITPPSGQRVRLSVLQAEAGAGEQVNMTLKVGANTLITTQTLSSESNVVVGGFKIGTGDSEGAVTKSQFNTHPPILGEVDEAIILTAAANTVSPISYNYEFGVLA